MGPARAARRRPLLLAPLLLPLLLLLLHPAAPVARAQPGGAVDPIGDSGAEVDDADSGAVRSIVEAARLGDLAGVKAALQRGDSIDETGQHKMDALIMAMKHYELEVATYLMAQKPNVKHVDDHGRNALLWAIWRQYVPIAEDLITRGADVNIENPDDRKTPLNYVTHHPHMKDYHHLVHMLVDAGADVNHIDGNHHSALYLSSMNGHTDCVEALLEHGADVNHIEKQGRYTSLHVAALNGRTEVAAALLEHGAQWDLPATDGYTALDLATRNGRKKIVKMMQAKAALATEL